MKNMIDLYSALDDPNFDGNVAPKNIPAKKNIISNKKPSQNNYNKNSNYGAPVKKNVTSNKTNINNNKNIKHISPTKKNTNNNKKLNSNNYIKNEIYEDNNFYDPMYEPIYNNPLSIFSPPKNEDNEEEEKNIIPGKQDIKSKIDIQKIETVVKSLNDDKYTYKSIEELQNVLKEISIKNNLNNEESQAFLVYCWVTKNISYYIGPRPDNTPLGALQKRITQCSGYARLFKQLLKIFNIKSILVHGIGRTYNLSPKPNKENHEWNAIKLNGEYYLCEVTWGAGKVENNKFVRSYNTFYFCCPPEIFINTHLPLSDLTHWTLLDKKISQEEFENLLYKDKFFYFYGFNDIKPREGVVKLNNNNTEVIITNNNQIKNLRLSCKVYFEHKLMENISCIEKNNNYFSVNLIFNKKGNYNVLYFTTDKEGTVNSDLIARQQFVITNNSKDLKTFPAIFNFKDEISIIEPKYNNLPKNREISFKFISNEIYDMGVVIDKKCTHLKKVDNIFEGKFTIKGEEILVGKFDIDNPGNLKVMIKYKVKK